MGKKKLIQSQLKTNPEFSKWLKAKPELVKKVKEDPSILEKMMVSWNRDQHKKLNLLRIGESYRQMVNQIQELNSLLQRVDHLVSNVKTISEKMNENKTPMSALESVKSVSKKKSRS